MKRMYTGLVIALATLVGCATPAPSAPAAAVVSATAVSAAPTTKAQFGPKFQVLLDEARRSDGHLRAGMDAYSPEFIRAMEVRRTQNSSFAPS